VVLDMVYLVELVVVLDSQPFVVVVLIVVVVRVAVVVQVVVVVRVVEPSQQQLHVLVV